VIPVKQRTSRLGLVALGLGLLALVHSPMAAVAQQRDPNVVKVPCRDMGDGRTLIDSGYLPDWAAPDTRWDIIAKKPASMGGEWANFVCTIRLKTGGR
jgi:hypothetical protein